MAKQITANLVLIQMHGKRGQLSEMIFTWLSDDTQVVLGRTRPGKGADGEQGEIKVKGLLKCRLICGCVLLRLGRLYRAKLVTGA